MKKLTDDQKEEIRDLLRSDEGTPADETIGESVKKLLKLSDEEYQEFGDEIEECLLNFFGDAE